MKKIFSYAAAIVAMLATAACSEKELEPSHEPDTDGQTINIRIQGNVFQTVQTKTGVEYDATQKTHHPYWNAGDQIGVLFDEFGSKTKLDVILANTSSDKASEADFSADNVTLNNGTTLGDDGRIYSFYPASAFNTDGVVAADEAVRVNLKAVQTPAAVDTYDPAADILVGQPSEYLYEEGFLCADIAFARAMSIVKVTLKAGSECPVDLAVNSFTMTAPEGTILTGRAKLSLAALYDDASPIMDWTVKNNTVTAKYNGGFHPVIGGSENTVYVVVNPTSIASGDVVFSIDTDDYTIEKKVSLTKPLTFPQSNVANISLTIDGSNCDPKVAETRILVESFNNTPKDNKEQMAASATGVAGTGVSENLSYIYSTANTNVRMGSNGQSSTNPFLWISGADQSLTMNNIVVNNETSLKLSFLTKTTQGSASVAVKYKESSSDTWKVAGTANALLNNWQKKDILFSISSSVESLDLQIIGSAGNLVVDDIVLEKFVDNRTTLSVPTNVTASLDSEAPNKINVSWTAVEHADKYEVVLSASDEDDVVLEPTSNSAEAAGLAYEKEYSIKVKAVTTDTENYLDSDYANATSTVTTGAKPTGVAEWIATSFDNLKAGDQVVIVGATSNGTYALSNDNGTSSAPTAVNVAASSNNLLESPEATIIWYVTIDEENVTFNTDKTGTKWLYCTNTNNGVRVGTNDAKTFTLDASGYLKHNGTSRYVGVYNDADWRCYSITTPSTHTNIGNQSFSFFVKTGGSEPEVVLSSISVKTAPTKTTYTEGEMFNPAGLVITKTMSDNSTEDVTYSEHESDFSFNPSLATELSTTNTQVTITYDGKATNQAITVNPVEGSDDNENDGSEKQIYSTSFSYPISGSAYNSGTPISGQDSDGREWTITYGNWNASTQAEFRLYNSGGGYGTLEQKFDLANVTKVEYKAKAASTNGAVFKLNTYYSTDGGKNWIKVTSAQEIATQETGYSFTISSTGEYEKVRIKFELDETSTKPTAKNTAMDITLCNIYGIVNE